MKDIKIRYVFAGVLTYHLIRYISKMLNIYYLWILIPFIVVVLGIDYIRRYLIYNQGATK